MWVQIILAAALCLVIIYSVYQKRKTYRRIDRLLDSVLSQEMIVYSDVEEGEFSALVSKSRQIQEVFLRETSGGYRHAPGAGTGRIYG